MACGTSRAVLLAVGLLIAAGCTPNDSILPSPTPSVSLASPSSAGSSQEAQVLRDYDAAEGAYRSMTAEVDRLAASGGASSATPVMRDTASGQYLAFQLDGLQIAKKRGWRTLEPTTIVGVARLGWSPRRIRLTACEDNSGVRIVNKTGRDVTPESSRRYVQVLAIDKIADRWKVTAASTTEVSNFKDRECAQ